jgi:Spy/CpxP family protein refolding chaperone
LNDWKTFLFGLSIGLNVAFLAVWGFFVLEDTLDRNGIVEDSDRKSYRHKKDDHKSDHRAGQWFYREKLGVSASRWEKIKPRLRDFHEKAHDLCEKIGRRRNELLGLIAAEDSSDSAIEGKKAEIIELRDRKQTMTIDYFSSKKEMLTARQQSKFFDMLRRDPHCEKHEMFLK